MTIANGTGRQVNRPERNSLNWGWTMLRKTCTLTNEDHRFSRILAEQNTFKVAVLATGDERHLTSIHIRPLQGTSGLTRLVCQGPAVDDT